MAFGDIVQANGGTIAGISSFNATLPGAITAGNLVVIMVAANNVPSGANTGWTKSTGLSPVANAQGLLWWFKAVGGDAIPTVTFASATTAAWRIVEYAGPFDASPYLASAGSATNGAFSSVTSPATTPTAGSNALLIAGLGGQSGADGSWNIPSVTLGSFTNSFVNASQQFRQAASEAHVACQVSRVVATASGSYSTTGAFSAPSTSGGSCRIEMGIAFKQGAVASGGGTAKVWSGGAWAAKPVKVWSGSAWVTKPVKFWTGTIWKPTAGDIGGIPPWTPAEISAGMFGWWDPSIAASLTFSGANLLEIADQSPANHKVGRAAGSGPVLTSINGLGALQYATGQGIATPDLAQFDDFTVCAVFKPGATVADYERVVDHAYASGWWLGRTGGTQTWGGGVLDGPGTGYGRFVTLANGEVHQISSMRKIDQHTISGNGGASLLTATVTAARTGAVRVTIADDNGNLSPLNGAIAEVIVWSRALSAADLAKVEGYLAHKWGIAAKLPAGHPYKAAPPPLVPTAPTDWLTVAYTPPSGRNNFTGEVGVRILINETRTFTFIGKLNAGSNSGLHRVRVYEWFADAVVAEAMIDMTGSANGAYAWQAVPPFTLTAGGYYSIMYDAVDGNGQQWGDAGPVSMLSFIGNIYGVYRSPGGPQNAAGVNTEFVGVDIGWTP
jgi:hypothetical protein